MIVKFIENRRMESSKATRIGVLLDYIAARGKKPVDKVESVFSSGDFYSSSWHGQRAEMIALAQEAARSKDPVDHWIFSWKEGESPTIEQCRDAVTRLKQHLRMTPEHLTMCALHKDTDNYHLHVVLNRVHPATYRVTDRGWSRIRAHRALAEIERVQGWEPEAGARYVCREDGKIVRRSNDSQATLRARTRDREIAAGEKSCERIAMEHAAPRVFGAESWQQVHDDLSLIGMRYELKGSGAVLWVGQQPIKASSIGREFSKTRMEQRLGAYEEDRQTGIRKQVRLVPQPLDTDSAHWQEYRAIRSRRKREKSLAVKQQRSKHRVERETQRVEFREQRRVLIGDGSWPGLELNVARHLLAEEQRGEHEGLKEQQEKERAELRGRFGRRTGYEQYLQECGGEHLVREWRYRISQPLPGEISGEGDTSRAARELPGFQASIEQSSAGRVLAITYRRYSTLNLICFRDRGRRIEVLETTDEASVLASLKLAQQKWGTVRVDGTAEFKYLCAKLATKHGISILNRDLQPQVAEASAAALPNNTYEVHKADILQYMKVRNPSQLDWMIAVRMRVTGHSQEAIAKSLAEYAPIGRAATERDWNLYAERTARAVFGPRGDRETQRNQSRKPVWRSLEKQSSRADSLTHSAGDSRTGRSKSEISR